jgi:integral membrane sensor domain MASE1
MQRDPSTRRASRGELAPRAVRFAAVVALYYGAAKLGLALAYANSSVTAVWAPTGIALAAVVLWGYRLWPAVALGALLANAWTGVPLGTVLGITAGNTLEALAGAYLLRRAAFDPRLERSRDVVVLVALAATVSTTVSATIGVLSLRVGHAVDTADVLSTWRTWWFGDMSGDLLAAPLLLVAFSSMRRERPWSLRQAVEATAIALLVAGVAVLAFAAHTPLEYLVFPPLIVAALRFRQLGAASAGIIVATIAVAFTAGGHGPFAHSSRDTSLVLSQTFMGVAGITALLLAAIMTEREHAVESMLRVRRREALALHDEVVQGLTVAKYAFDSGSEAVARRAVDNSLARSRGLVDELLEDAASTAPYPGGLRLTGDDR